MEKLKAIIEGLTYSISNISDIYQNDKEEAVCWVAIALSYILAIINSLYCFIRFMINSGYKIQFDLIKQWNIIEAFTLEGLNQYYTSILMIIMCIIIVLTGVCMIRKYLRNESSSQKGLIRFISMFIMFCFTIFILMSTSLIHPIIMMLNSFVGLQTFALIALIVFIGFVASIFAITKILKTDDSLCVLVNQWKSLMIIGIIGIPLGICLIENIIPMILTVLFIVCLWLITKVFVSADVSDSSAHQRDTDSTKKIKASMPHKETKYNKKPLKIEEFTGNVRFVRAEGMTGNKYIKAIYSLGGTKNVCSQRDFDEGKVIIVLDGVRIEHIYY